jgi:glutamate-1-semialdehyde 2,1-aminomutase
MHLLTKVNPDILVLGKTMGNGYPITAVLSNGKLLKKSTNCFISSTFWSDRIGFVAALKTIKVMKKTKSWVHLINSGKHLNNEVKNIAKKNDLKISINGYESITYFEIISKNNQEYKTFIAQEMLKNKFLATNLAYMTINHDWKLINDYSKILNNIFAQIRRFEDGEPIKKYLKGPVIRKSFQRLN